MNQKRIVIDGKVYNSVDEMPEEIRQKYLAAIRNLDKNNDGTPDMLENMDALFGDKDKDGMPDSLAGLVANVVKATRIVADGKEYNSLEELPPEVRAKLSQAMGKFDANQNGIPDFMENGLNNINQTTNVASTAGFDTPPRSQPMSVSSPLNTSVVEPESTSGWMIALAGLFIFMLCVAVAAAVWYFFLR